MVLNDVYIGLQIVTKCYSLISVISLQGNLKSHGIRWPNYSLECGEAMWFPMQTFSNAQCV